MDVIFCGWKTGYVSLPEGVAILPWFTAISKKKHMTTQPPSHAQMCHLHPVPRVPQ